jgi:hypothetical protein
MTREQSDLIKRQCRQIGESLRFLAKKSVKLIEVGPVMASGESAHFIVTDRAGAEYRVLIERAE